MCWKHVKNQQQVGRRVELDTEKDIVKECTHRHFSQKNPALLSEEFSNWEHTVMQIYSKGYLAEHLKLHAKLSKVLQSVFCENGLDLRKKYIIKLLGFCFSFKNGQKASFC